MGLAPRASSTRPPVDQRQQHRHHRAHDGLGDAPDAGDRPGRSGPASVGGSRGRLRRSSLSGLMRRPSGRGPPGPPSARPTRCSAPAPFSTIAREPPAAQHRDAVAEGDQLVQVGRDHQRADALVRQLPDAGPDGPGREDVEAVGRLVEDHQAGVVRRARARARPSGCCRPRACRRACAGPGVRMSNSAIFSRALRSISRVPMVPRRQNGAWPIRFSTRFRPTDSGGHRALAQAVVADVAEAQALALAHRQARDRDARGSGCRRRPPAAGPRSPPPARAGRCRRRRRSPMISPGRTRSETPCRPSSPPRGGTSSSSSSSTGASQAARAAGDGPPTCSCSSTSSGSGAACSPNIISTIAACSSSSERPRELLGARGRPTRVPASAPSRGRPCPVASWSLWVMRTTARPWPFSRSMAAASSATPRGVSIEVGSSRISTFEPRQSAFTISICCCWPEAQGSGLGVGVHLDAEHVRHLGQTRAGARARRAERPAVAHHQVVERGERRDQRRVLVDHPDPELDRPLRARRSGPARRRCGSRPRRAGPCRPGCS